MVTEKILMEAVERGRSRQEMHEVIKEHSVAAAQVVKNQGFDNDLLHRLANDPRMPFTPEELTELTSETLQYTGRAEQQTDEFLDEIVQPLLDANSDALTSIESSLNV